MKTYWNYFNLGRASAGVGDLKLAEEAFKKATKIRPNEYKAHYNLGYVYMKEEKYDEAAESFTTCIKIDKENLAAYYLRGKSFHMSGYSMFNAREYNTALNLFLNAIADYLIVYARAPKKEVYSNLCIAYYNAALSSCRAGDSSRANEIIKEANERGFSSKNLEELEKAVKNIAR